MTPIAPPGLHRAKPRAEPVGDPPKRYRPAPVRSSHSPRAEPAPYSGITREGAPPPAFKPPPGGPAPVYIAPRHEIVPALEAAPFQSRRSTVAGSTPAALLAGIHVAANATV